ncbi:MAG TPA: serine/threonine-protein kinase [Victivallales bacterium]|nr:serine/threonine-protein kinase [Victivallales bacterium]HRU01989.1 serine/threonine-protein kinase [Victivallales bacterium]
MPYLIFCTGEEKEAIELNTPSETTIGRTSDNDITILDDSSVSRKHLLIKVHEDGKATAEDLGSSNGTTINNLELADKAVNIPNGARIKTGDAEFIFCYNNFEEYADAILPPLKLRIKDKSQQQEQSINGTDQNSLKLMLDTVMIEREDPSELTLTTKLPVDSFGLAKGEEIEGYRIIRDLGEGYYSKTYLAYQKSVDRTVALKTFRIIQDFDVNEAFENFKMQILKTVNIDNPRLLHYFDCGVSSRIIFISMPYISEGNLKDKISKNGKFSAENAISIALIIAETLNSLYQNTSSYHLSLNPSNIVFSDNDDIMLADYSLKLWKNKYCIKNESAQTWIRYDSPELRTGEMPDHRSDIYSIGVLLCEMLTGVIAYDKSFNLKSAIDSCKAPKELISIIRMATESSKNARIQSYDALIKMLRQINKIKKIPGKLSQQSALKIKQYQPPRKIIIKPKN